MADVYNFIAERGLITSSAGEILEQVANEYKAVFGQDLVVPDSLNIEGASTPQGLLIVTEALARIAVANNNIAVSNQINPNIAGGIFLDSILALSGMERTPALPSLVSCTLTGVPGTTIPEGSQASVTGTGAIFECASTVEIPVGGTLTNILFRSIDTGEVAAPPNTLTTIVGGVLGWETVTNPEAADLGQDTQSDESARAMRLVTLGEQGSSVAQAIIAGVSLVEGVNSLVFRENTANTSETIDGVGMEAHSIYVCVDGVDDGTFSTAVITLGGTPTTIIAAGSQVSETVSGQEFIFALDEEAVIGGGGTVDANFTAISTGFIEAPIGSLTVIETPISGWDTATNAAAAIPGTESAVAEAIMSKKSAGAGFSNTAGDGQGIPISAVVINPYSDQYITVLYDKPTPVDIYVTVNIKLFTPIQDPEAAVIDAINNYSQGLVNGVPGLTVGQNVSAFELAGAITTQYPGIYVTNVLISTSPTPTVSAEIPIDIFEIAVIDDNNINVVLT